MKNSTLFLGLGALAIFAMHKKKQAEAAPDIDYTHFLSPRDPDLEEEDDEDDDFEFGEGGI